MDYRCQIRAFSRQDANCLVYWKPLNKSTVSGGDVTVRQRSHCPRHIARRFMTAGDIWDKNVVGAQFHTSVTNMSSSEEDVLVAYWSRRRIRRKIKYWVHLYNLTNVHHSCCFSRAVSTWIKIQGVLSNEFWKLSFLKKPSDMNRSRCTNKLSLNNERNSRIVFSLYYHVHSSKYERGFTRK